MGKKQRLPSILGQAARRPPRSGRTSESIFFSKAQAVNSVSDALPPSNPHEIASEAFDF